MGSPPRKRTGETGREIASRMMRNLWVRDFHSLGSFTVPRSVLSVSSRCWLQFHGICKSRFSMAKNMLIWVIVKAIESVKI